MDKTVRALEDLSATDGQLRGDSPLTDVLIKTLERRRAALRNAIPQPFLVTYDALGRAGRRPAVVPVRNAHCGGCYLRLPPQLAAAIRHRQSLCSCPHCRRLLYLPAPAETENAGAAQPALERHPAKAPSSKRLARLPARRSARARRPPAAKPQRRRV